MRIPISKPWFTDAEHDAVRAPLLDGWVVQGPRVREFERQFASFIGADRCTATTSCTSAMQVALAALNVRLGDEVIVPAFTWVATANVVELAGARPVFCDIDLDTFNLNVAHAESLVGARTVGIIPVHLFGLCADMDQVLALARRRNLWVVEDSACGFGARIRGQHSGTFGELGCFSFHPRKAITTGEGGMISTSSASLDLTCRSLRDHGVDTASAATRSTAGRLSEYTAAGANYRLTDIQAALGTSQLARADVILAQKKRQAALYDAGLAPVGAIQRPSTPDGFEHGYQSYVCLVRPEAPNLSNVERLSRLRGAIMTRLDQSGIGTRQGTHAAALTAYYRTKYGIRPEDVPNAYLAESLTIALPLYHLLTDAEITEVAATLADAVEGVA